MAEKEKRLQIRVSPEEKKQIEEEAKKMHLSTSAYVRSKLLSSDFVVKNN